MKKLLSLLLTCVGIHAAAQTNVTPGLPISRYPRVTSMDAPDIFIIARTNITPATNMGVPFLILSNDIAAQLATTNFVILATNGLSSVGFAGYETFTNGIQIAIGTNVNWVSWVTGVLSGTSLSLGVDGRAITNGLASLDFVTNFTAHGGFVSGITNLNYATNTFIDLGQTNYAVWNITNTSGHLNLLFTNLTVGFNFTVLVDGENIDGGTTATNWNVFYTWPHASVSAQWLGFTTNDWVTSNKVLGISGFIRRTNSVIISSRE